MARQAPAVAAALALALAATGCAHSRNGPQEVWTVARVVTVEYREPCTASDGAPAVCVRRTSHEGISPGFGNVLAGLAGWAAACLATPAACVPW